MLNNKTRETEELYEFKGSTSAKLEILFIEVKGLRKDVNELKSWKSWVVGLGAGAGAITSLFTDWLIKK